MITITYITKRYEVTVEMPLTEQDVVKSVLDVVAEFVKKLTPNHEGDRQ